MRTTFLILLNSCWLAPAAACSWCRPRVQAGIHTPAYTTNMLLVLLPVAVLLALGMGVFYWDKLRAYFSAAYTSH